MSCLQWRIWKFRDGVLLVKQSLGVFLLAQGNLLQWPHTLKILLYAKVLEVCRERRQLKNEANPIKLQVHFESYCKDSKRFITTQLYPTWQEIGHLFEVELFPYGKATVSKLLALLLKKMKLLYIFSRIFLAQPTYNHNRLGKVLMLVFIS